MGERKLTDVAIRKLKPGDKSRKISDGGGMYLEVATTGGKLWRYAYQFQGKQKLLALGKYPDVSLQEARKRHGEARELLTKGVDPSAAKKAAKLAGAEKSANSFEVVAREWFELWKADREAGYPNKIMTLLEKDVFPWLGLRPVAEISAPEVLAVLRRIEKRGVTNPTHKAKEKISQIMRYAIATGRAVRDPVPDLRGAIKPIRNGHFASLTNPAQVAELLRAIDAYQGTYQVRAMLRLAPLVFVRPGELRQAKWADIDLENTEWNYVVSKTKTEHHVPLAKQAVEILRDLYPLTGGKEYVFPGVRPGRPLSDMTLNRALQTMGYDTQQEITGHGFRAMARTILAEKLHLQPEVIEHQLAHKVPDRLGMAYNRTKYLDDRKIMMQTWADYLDKIKAGEIAGVIPFPAAG
jgi:integrase